MTGRGRPTTPKVTRDSTVLAAIGLMDEHGPDSLTMRRLASKLEITAMSLYNHFDDKEAILDGVVEVLLAEAELPTDSLPWEDWLRLFGERVARLARRHPGAISVFTSRPLITPHSYEPIEAFLASLQKAGASPARSWELMIITTNVVITYVAAGAANAKIFHSGRQPDPLAFPRQSFPHLHAARSQRRGIDVLASALEVLKRGIAAELRTRPIAT